MLLKSYRRSIAKPILLCFGLFILVELAVLVIGNSLWFAEVGYENTFLKQLSWQLGLGWGSAILSLCFILANLRLAHHLRWQKVTEDTSPLTPQSPSINLPSLLIIAVGIGAWIGSMLLYYSKLALNLWTPDFNLPNLSSNLTSPLQIVWIRQVLSDISGNLWQGILIALLVGGLLLKTEYFLRAIAIVFSILLSFIVAGQWSSFLKYFYAVPFNINDPQYGRNLGFYIFNLPLWQLLELWLSGLGIYTLFAVSLTYLFSAESLSQGKFPGFSRPQLRHLYALWSGLMGLLVFHHVIQRYLLLYSPQGVVYGAGYIDIHVGQFVEIILGIIAGITCIWLGQKAIFSKRNRHQLHKRRRRNQVVIIPYLIPVFLYVMVWIIGTILSAGLQRTLVQPNELVRERPYIERSIKFTRAAFSLDKIDAQIFDPQAELNTKVLERNHLTVDNIRLWDTKPLLETNRQLQQIRLYYKFPDADIDRYRVQVGSRQQIEERQISEKQQTIIAARELDYNAVPSSANTWVNKHLTYTHGYGFTLSPVNLVSPGGLPYYFVKDIGTNEDEGALQTSSELIDYSIPIGKPRIYYGELTNNYVMTPTTVEELDFPSGDGNVYNTYDGKGGVEIGKGWRRWLFALYLRDWQMLFTQDFTPETRLLMRRDIQNRVQTIAPFLNYDRNPYLVAADVGDDNSKLHWIIDAYTISDRYPYSQPSKDKFNYIRNSVKVVVDAYHGTVNFYVTDENDPIIQTWKKIFPHLFKSLAEMPKTLRSHIRYPEDLFSTQAERLLTYHMIDPQVFYNREDQWEIPLEIYGTEQQPVSPYYLIMKLPDADKEEFILLNPYTPSSRQNLIAWLAARSDDTEYGKLLLYQFPKQRLVYGPNQIEALINQDPDISQQISLWNRDGSKVLQGHLLVIPIEQSLLYVEPLYLVAEQNSVPTIARVIVAYQNKIVMEPTLKEALEKLF
jgi:uncharacterized membrane protein (UPF0182 family)